MNNIENVTKFVGIIPNKMQQKAKNDKTNQNNTLMMTLHVETCNVEHISGTVAL